jgi:hypothetical protein
MSVIQAVLASFVGLMTPRASVTSHYKHQAYGPRWSQRRRRRIDSYRRRRPRRY